MTTNVHTTTITTILIYNMGHIYMYIYIENIKLLFLFVGFNN